MLRKVVGLNLVNICGAGSKGVAVEVRQSNEPGTFVVKLTRQPVAGLKKGGVLCEAALICVETT